MLSLKAVVESVVEQGRRAILQATRAKINQAGNTKPPKLSEAQGDKVVCRPRPKSVLPNQHPPEAHGSLAITSTALSSSGGGIVNLLRPVTSRIVQGLVRRVSSPLWAEARRRSAKRLFGETAPYFALVGVTLVSGPERGLLTAQDELEAICGDIREAISRAGWIHDPNFWRQPKRSCESPAETSKGFSLDDFEFGSAINKGCNAVVYAAKWKEAKVECTATEETCTNCVAEEMIANPPRLVESLEHLFSGERFWPLDRLESDATSSRKEDNDRFSLSSKSPINSVEDEDGANSCLGTDTFSTDEELSCIGLPEEQLELSNFHSLNSLNGNEYPPSRGSLVSSLRVRNSISLCEGINNLLSSGGFQARGGVDSRKRKKVKFKVDNSEESSGYVHGPPTRELHTEETSGTVSSIDVYPLALKMMFNYEAESNAPAILTAMYKEMIPAKSIELDDVSTLWKNRLLNWTVTLPPHSNIVDMPCVFVDRIPALADGLHLYPDALPKRINPSGYGRNMSLFCVMKRYDCTLAEYLSHNTPSTRTSLLLLTQLLESVNHINKYNVAHRDIKSDNVLLCLREGMDSPHLVLSDFGCCLADPSLCVSFSSYEADPRVGNAALMAPEIKSATPGLLTWLNYSKSDLWSAGTIAYEIFGLDNPFTSPVHNDSSNNATALDSVTYKEHQIPRLPKTVPAEIRYLIYNMLKRNPKHRPSPTVAATVCQLSLWGPRKWLNRHALAMPSHNEVMRWLLCLSTKVICEAGSAQNSGSVSSQGAPSYVPSKGAKETMSGQLEYEIVSTFLKRVHYSDIIQAIKWIRAF